VDPMGNAALGQFDGGASDSAKLLVPQRESRMYQASTTPGTVPASSESSTGILPPWLASYTRWWRVSARSLALSESTFFCLAS